MKKFVKFVVFALVVMTAINALAVETKYDYIGGRLAKVVEFTLEEYEEQVELLGKEKVDAKLEETKALCDGFQESITVYNVNGEEVVVHMFKLFSFVDIQF